MAATRACIISPEIVGPHANGGVGTHCFYLSAFLSRQLGQEVTFLYTGKIERRTEAYWREWFREQLGVEFVWLPPPTDHATVPVPVRSVFVRTARNVYDWLRERPFDVCHFQEMLGHGFRCFQAKRLGLAFQKTLLTCTVHSSWEWICQAMQMFPQVGMEETQTKYLERYSIEHCDQLISPSQYMLSWLAQNRVPTRAPATVLPYLFDEALQPVGHRPCANKLIFFGRLEVRKGLLLFLDTLLALDQAGRLADRELEVTFLGKSGYTPGGGGSDSIERYRPKFSPAVKIRMVTDLDHRQAMDFLKANNDALVVCPSLIDNSPYAIIESLQLGLNVIAARSGGIPELFADDGRLFEPEPGALGDKLIAGLKGELPPPVKRYNLEQSKQLWKKFCEQTSAASPGPRPEPPPSAPPRVQVLLSTAQPAGALKTALEALERQSFRGFSLGLVQGGGPALPPELEEYCRRRGWTQFAAGEERKTGALPGPQCSVLVLLGPGCVPEPAWLECLVKALEHTGLAGLTCCARVATGEEGPEPFIYEPLGPCLEAGIFANVFGAGCLALKTSPGARLPAPGELFRTGGIWAHLAEMSAGGQSWDVCPPVLVNLAVPDPSFSMAGLDYTGHLKVVESYCRNLPVWQRYLMVNAIAEQRNLLGIGRAGDSGDGRPKPLLFKLRRETRRLIKQCRSLVRRP